MNPPKVLIIGAENSGKTALFDVLVHHKLESNYLSSCSASTHKIESYWIWDIPSDIRFQSIRESNYNNAFAVILCYPNNLQSLDEFDKHVNYLKSEIKKIYQKSPKCKFLLVQTKSDIATIPPINESIQDFIAQANEDFEAIDLKLESYLKIGNAKMHAQSDYYPSYAVEINQFITNASNAFNDSNVIIEPDFFIASTIKNSLKPDLNFILRHLEYAALTGGVVLAIAALATFLSVGCIPLTITLGVASIAMALSGIGMFASKKNTGPMFLDTPLTPVIDSII